MANYNTLKGAIEQVIKTNGNNEITGALLQQSLIAMINSLGAGYQFAGVAVPATEPGMPDYNVFYFAGPGTYPNFNNATIPARNVGLLSYNGTWHVSSVQTTPFSAESVVDNIIQLYDGTTPVYPRTKAEAVFFDNDTTKTLDKKMNDFREQIQVTLSAEYPDINKRLNASGEEVATGGYETTGFVSIENVESIHLKGHGTSTTKLLCFYSGNTEASFISAYPDISNVDVVIKSSDFPANTAFVRACSIRANEHQLLLIYSATKFDEIYNKIAALKIEEDSKIEKANNSISALQVEVDGETPKVLLSPSRNGTIKNAGNAYAVTWLNIPCKNADFVNVCVKKPFSASGNVYVFGYTMVQGYHDDPAADIANGFYQDTINKVLAIPCAGLESINIHIYETSLPFSYPSSVTPLRVADFQAQQGLEYFLTKGASLYNLVDNLFGTKRSAGIVGDGNTYVSHKVYGLLPGKTYGIRVSNWDWSGVTSTGMTFEIVNFVGENYTRLFFLYGVQTPIPDVVLFTIPSVSSYIQIGGRVASGVTALFEIYEVEQSSVEKNYTYIGQPLSLNKYGLNRLFSLSDFGTLTNPMSSQGFDIKDNILCQLSSSAGTNTIVIANISTRTILGEIIFADTSYHMNNVNMGSKYEQNDTYPLLWISQCYGDHKCAVVRLNNDLSGYTLIQEIKYTGTEHFSGSNAYDWTIDELNGCIYAIGNSPDGSRIEVVKFALPQISGSDVNFTDDDVLDSFVLTDAPSTYQGSRVIGGRIFMPFGFGTVAAPAIICVIDTNSKSIVTRVPLSSVGEVEACTPYWDGLIINNNSTNPTYRFLGF